MNGVAMSNHGTDEPECGFYLDAVTPLADRPPSDKLLDEIGWRRDVYAFEFSDAIVVRDDNVPTSSWIEVGHSRQLGGCYVVWFSGVSSLDAPDYCSYGWLECRGLGKDFDDALFKRSLLQGAPLTGYFFNSEVYYDNCPSAHPG